MAKISNPDQLMQYKLGTALGLERKVKTMLRMMERQASMDMLKEGFARHREETEQQIRNIEQALEALGGPTSAHQDPVMNGIAQQAEQMLGKVDDEFVDAVLAGGAADTEHHEISTYRALITMAASTGHEDVVALLEENLEQEERTRDEVEQAMKRLAQQMAQTSTPA